MLGGVFLATKLAWKMIGHCFNGNFFSTFCVHMLWLSIFCQSLSSFFLLKKYWHSQMSVGETKRIQYLTLQSEREWEKLQTLSTFLSGSKAFDLISYFYKVLHLWILKQLPTYKATHYSECCFCYNKIFYYTIAFSNKANENDSKLILSKNKKDWNNQPNYLQAPFYILPSVCLFVLFLLLYLSPISLSVSRPVGVIDIGTAAHRRAAAGGQRI